MNRNTWILLLILLCVAFLVSCQKKETADTDKAELVRIEAPGEYPGAFPVNPAQTKETPENSQGKLHTYRKGKCL